MTRGRKRKHDPSIPAHIDQAKLPAGMYWDRSGSGRWFVFEKSPDGERVRKTVATRKARMSELHEIIEQRAGIATGTLGALLDLFHESKTFKSKSQGTRDHYDKVRKAAKAHRTKIGLLGSLQVASLSVPFVQRIVDKLADEGTPTKANALVRYLRRVFDWGIRRDHCKANPAAGIEHAREAWQDHEKGEADARLPAAEAVRAVLAYAKAGAALKAHTRGSVAPYLWIVIELCYALRLRGIEALMLTDASATDVGVRVRRVKGSNDTVVRWSPRLRAAWDAAVVYRKKVTPKGAVIPIEPANRPLIVSQSGKALRKSSLDTAWQRMIRGAMKDGAISAEQRFSLHGMKHRGITDTKGTRADKKEASGHVEDSMMDTYDHSVPVVEPAGEESTA